MKYIFKFLIHMVALIFWPITAGWEWLISHYDWAWCWFWHFGHDWRDISYPKTAFEHSQPFYWCTRCHVLKNPPKNPCTTCGGTQRIEYLCDWGPTCGPHSKPCPDCCGGKS